MADHKMSNHFNCTEINTIKTPRISHIRECEWENVYEPAEDTFLLLDALEKDLPFINSMNPRIVLEVGSGSGVVITALSQVLHSSSHCLSVDINPHACRITKSTALENHTKVEVIQADLTSCLKKCSVDMIIFNPPYVVTPSHEVTSKNLLTKSWAGGINGREVIDKFLEKFINVMNENSFGYLLVLKENQPQEIINELFRKQFSSEIIVERKIRGEELIVIKFRKLLKYSID